MMEGQTIKNIASIVLGIATLAALTILVFPKKVTTSCTKAPDTSSLTKAPELPHAAPAPVLPRLEAEAREFEKANPEVEKADHSSAANLLTGYERSLANGEPLQSIEPYIARILPYLGNEPKFDSLTLSLANKRSPSASLLIVRRTWKDGKSSFPSANKEVLDLLKTAAEGGYSGAKLLFCAISVSESNGFGVEDVFWPLDPIVIPWLHELQSDALNQNVISHQIGSNNLFSPAFYLGLAHHLAAVVLATPETLGARWFAALRPKRGSVEQAILDHGREAEIAYGKSAQLTSAPFERNFAMLLRYTLLLDARVTSNLLYQNNLQQWPTDADKYFNRNGGLDSIASLHFDSTLRTNTNLTPEDRKQVEKKLLFDVWFHSPSLRGANDKTEEPSKRIRSESERLSAK